MQKNTTLLPDTRRDASPGTFDYDLVPASVQRAVREQAEAIQGLLSKTSANVVQIGLRLQFVRDRLGHAHFQPWLKTEFQWSPSVASNYMRAARTFSELDCLGQFQPSALFVLARKKCPAAARADAIRRARQGQRVTKTLALELVERHTTVETSRCPILADRLRQYLFKTLRKLPAGQIEQLAEELLQLARQMKADARNR